MPHGFPSYRIAKASERARDRLREDSEIDEIAVRRIADRSNQVKSDSVHKREQPRKAVAHQASAGPTLLQVGPDERIDVAVEHAFKQYVGAPTT